MCTNVGGATELLQIAPIPPLLVYCGFDQDLNALAYSNESCPWTGTVLDKR